MLKFRSIYHSMPLKRKLYMSFLMITSLLIGAIAFVVYNVSASILISKAIDSTQQNIDLITFNLDRMLKETEAFTNSAVANVEVQRILRSSSKDGLGNYSDSISMTGALDSVVSAGTFIESIVVFDQNGRKFDSGKVQNYSYPDVSEYDYLWELPIRERQFWIDTHQTLYTIRGTHQDVITYVKAFYNAVSGSNLGIIQVNVNENNISDIYAGVPLGENGKIFILNGDGAVASSLDKSELYDMEIDKIYYSLLTDIRGSVVFNDNDIEHLVVYQKYEKLDWTIVGIVPTKELTKEKSLLIVWTTVVLVIGFAVLSFFIVLLSNSIFNPILSLKRTIEHVAEGDLEARAEIFYDDEVGKLSEEFNNMVCSMSVLMENLVEEQKKKRQHELSLLQSQINPHFLYNTLENLCGLAELGRNEDLIWLVNELSQFYRGVLSSGSMIIPLKEELEISKRYLNILQISYPGKLEYTLEVDEEVTQYSTIKLLLQPLIENSFQHGIKYKDKAGKIDICGRIEGDMIVFTVTDNGIGIKPEDLDSIFTYKNNCYRPKSFGLSSTNERIKIYFGNECGLNVMSIYGLGTTVTVRFFKRLNGGV